MKPPNPSIQSGRAGSGWPYRTVKSAVLAVCVAALACGCAGRKVSQAEESATAVQAVRDEVARVVADTGRREKALAAVDRFEVELKTFSATVATFQRSLHVLNADPDATRAQFNELIGRFQAERKVSRARLAQIHAELLAATTEEEWRSIARREAEIVPAEDPARTRGETK